LIEIPLKLQFFETENLIAINACTVATFVFSYVQILCSKCIKVSLFQTGETELKMWMYRQKRKICRTGSQPSIMRTVRSLENACHTYALEV